MRRRPPPDLAVVAGLAVIGALAAVLPLHGWLQALLVGPLVLALPGYALAAALFPPRTLSRGERLVHAFVFSIAAAAIGGVVLQLLLDLHHTVFLLLELAVTLGAGAVARRRRRTVRPSGARAQPAPAPGPGIVVLLGYAAAIVIAIAAVGTASSGVREQQNRQVFTSLWAVPDAGDPSLVRVGVWSHGGPEALQLRVAAGEEVLTEIPVELSEGPRWEETLPANVEATAPDLTLTLLNGSVPYRSVALNVGAGE